ncbi:hypothetical protein FYJ51_05115 [Erysipelotrichaceae bacterium Oil+RF-744-GAM-WT-6]|jgi:hypothetical protein|uniref:Uncharacterized protein n=1 Tax=Stecheria intestinalis TaxID=2606630 RepID=A0A7X2NSF3_9FIRM|nr:MULTISPECIES: hypothetical protein [Erysipelotrichaceae]MCI2154850.1 hypothetical protein [Solobacterium sp.]MDY3233884.1 hypothetical protein [Erysipelotrichaceae bacterium]MDY4681440.1 hypothetical protein [Lachnospiraceae bacterium]MCI6745047.1 hypothetical protein [Anaerolactibacter massiliensis]MDD5881072.1 hypothetical protein [Stecheria intestinalis]
MTDRINIYLLLEQIHNEVFPNESFGVYMKKIDELIGPMEKLDDGEIVTRLYHYLKSPFQKVGMISH